LFTKWVKIMEQENIFSSLAKILKEQNRSESDINEIFNAYKFRDSGSKAGLG